MARVEKKTQKGKLHSRNPHQGQYNFPELISICPELGQFIIPNHAGLDSIDFGEPKAVKALNRALLKKFYEIEAWDIPETYLCPPIPGRADYIHYAADLLAESWDGKIPKGKDIRVLDIGVGANCVYPIIGTVAYGWSFVACDIDEGAFQSASKIVEMNPKLKALVELRFQKNSKSIFKGIVKEGERFHLSICNPPFHASLEEANAVNERKWRNLGKAAVAKFWRSES
jgi:23S rRNA (adenine1618-N6)-methyltransferase